MHRCRLVIDSCCDLPHDLIEWDGISLLEFDYVLEGGTFSDDLFQTTTPQAFYDAMRKGAKPTTSQLSMQTLSDAFTEMAKEGTPTVFLSFTSGLSGSYDIACIVRDQIKEAYPDFELHVVDTLLPSIAEGLFVFEAIKQWERDLSARELAEWAEEAKHFVDCQFMVEDLDALRRGGRIPGSVAVAGAALDVKPLLTVDADGKLALCGVARGRKKGLRQLAEYYAKNAEPNEYGNYVVIGSADAPKDLQRLHELLEKENEGILLIETSIGPVIGAHVGPGMVAVAFWGKDKRERMSMADRIAKRVKGDH